MSPERITELEAILASGTASAQEQIETLNALAVELRFQDLARSIALCEQAIELAAQPGTDHKIDQSARAQSLLNLGTFLTQDGQFERALNILSKAQLAYEVLGNRERSARTLSAIGRVYIYLSDYANALDYHLHALDIAQQISAAEIEAISLNNIGYMYINTAEWGKALPYLQQSLTLAEKSGDLRAQADALANSCYCYAQQGDYINARQTGQHALELYQEIESPQGMAEVLINLGSTYQLEGDDLQALEHYQHALQTSQTIGDRLETARGLRRVGEAHVRLNKIDTGRGYLQQALELAQQVQSTQEQMHCHFALSNAHRLAENFTDALAHYEQYHALTERIFNEEADRRLKMIEVGYRSDTALQQAETFRISNLALQQEINERLEAEKALQHANELLEQEIAERERLISDLNAFSYMVAHDLRNPINAITGYTSLLNRRLRDTEDIQLLNFIEIIAQTGLRMNRIIDELLLLASLRQDEMETAPVDMAKVIGEVESRLALMIEQHQANVIKPETWPIAQGYAPWIEEVWANYITNALKYGGMPPQVQLGAWQMNNGFVRFWVQDNGDGVSAEDQPRLFNAFTRLEQARARGHGLGLSIVKRIVERLGGEVGLASPGLPGQGSTFFFTLPAVSQDEPEVQR